MSSLKLFRGLGLLGVVAIATACSTTDGVDDSTTDGPKRGERSGEKIQQALDALPNAHVANTDSTGVPTFVTGNLGSASGFKLTGEDLRDVLERVAPIFRADASQLVFRGVRTDNIADLHYIYAQQKNGRAVLGGDLAVHVRNGVAYAANGTVRDDLPASVETKISVDAAIAKAKGEYGTLADLAASSKGELSYVRTADRLELVYSVEVTGTKADQTPVQDRVLVSAVDGKVTMRIPRIHTARNREVHNLNHGTTLPGPVERTEGQEPAADETVNLNYDRLGTTYDGYHELFGRDSFDNAGAKLISSVHYSNNYVNAFWNGTQMVYGDGDGVNASNLAHSLDVTAHELTHAVTDATSDLIYSGESGGLNESMSDIFGNVIEWYRDGKVVSANTWMVGEDCWTPNIPNDALRYMDDPSKDGDSLDWYPDYSGGVDVHYSSGISNLAFYLLAQGGTHPHNKSPIVVTGIGVEKAAQIFFRANTTGIFQPSTNFEQAKTGTELAAQQLGYSTDEIASVTNAWKAVGVGVPIPPPPTTPLENGVPKLDLSGSSGSKTYFTLEVPLGQDLKFDISGPGTGDADLYVKFGAAPTTTSYDCRPYKSGNVESCVLNNSQAGTYYVMLHAYSAYTGVKLLGQYQAPPPPGKLVINEVDYDQTGNNETLEFIEIYNSGGLPVSLAGHTLYLVDGIDDSLYSIVDLSSAGTLGPGQYLVVGDHAVAVPAGVKKISFHGLSNQIQNGSPDGIAIATATTLVDALSYGGVLTTAPIPGLGLVSLVEGARTTAKDSNTAARALVRLPNGADTNNAATDWAASPNVTPGAANN